MIADTLLSRPLVSRLYGRLQDRNRTRRRIAATARALGIDMAECATPLAKFTSFNDFFCRALKAEARPITPAPSAVIAPCDARLLAVAGIAMHTPLPIKCRKLHLERLLVDDTLASRFVGGTLLVYRLCPADYHRFHFPETCVPSAAVTIAGPLHSVNPIALAAGRRVLDRNLRHRTLLDTGGAAGSVCMVEVGAMCVGSIVQTYTPDAPAARGAQKGLFRFGGSTVIALYEPDRLRIDDDVQAHSREGIETLVRLGTSVGTYR